MLVVMTLAAGGAAIAADTKTDQKPAQGTDRSGTEGMHGGMRGMMQGDRSQPGGDMMHGDMMGMMDMMGRCSQMMGHGSPMSGMPKLPRGNDKLQLQMEAEMMQKMGEILSSYAARLPDAQRSGR
ncbi:MAG TPA: hypothetical protein VJ722_00485 [Rhodanobacteraceae bacterium]|nr:hypothetical protein [Rhodanobacteraceae bacterium]